MRLKQKWPAIIIWILFVIFNVIMVAGSGYTSGLFPEVNTVLYTGTITLLGIAIMNTLTYFLGNLSDSFELYKLGESKVCNVIYTVMMVATVIGAYITRFLCLVNSNAEPPIQISLYENAVIGGTNRVPDNGLLSVTFSKILSGILLFTGNRPSVAYVFSAVLSCIFIILSAIAIKLLLGRLASLVYALFVAFMPPFLESFSKLELTTDPLFLCMFGIELLFIAIYLRKASDGKYTNAKWIPWYMIVGAVIGFMGYVDAGTFVVVLPLLIAALVLLRSTVGKELVRLIFVIGGALLAFIAMIIQEGGIAGFNTVFDHWHKYFFHNVNTFDAFWTYTDYKLIYLIALIAMSGIIVGFWKNTKVDNVSPFLFSMIILFAATPLLGATKMNGQLMTTIFYGIIIACVAAIIVMEPTDAELYDEELEDLGDEEDEGLRTGTSRVVTPERDDEPEPKEFADLAKPDETTEPEPDDQGAEDADEESDADGEPEADDQDAEEEPEADADDQTAEEEPEADEEDAEDEPEVEEEPAADPGAPVGRELTLREMREKIIAEREAEAQATKAEAPKPEEPRFVPEGMVLPKETEADADEIKRERPKKKVPQFEGKIALNRKDNKEGNKDTSRREPRYEFDIQIEPGDDFDI
ncbi:MAG: hypothetical protein IKO84_10555 [Butyrivibrio sp.]|nr:hypothetical protein [Butyrivibrio sp.]